MTTKSISDRISRKLFFHSMQGLYLEDEKRNLQDLSPTQMFGENVISTYYCNVFGSILKSVKELLNITLL